MTRPMATRRKWSRQDRTVQPQTPTLLKPQLQRFCTLQNEIAAWLPPQETRALRQKGKEMRVRADLARCRCNSQDVGVNPNVVLLAELTKAASSWSA